MFAAEDFISNAPRVTNGLWRRLCVAVTAWYHTVLTALVRTFVDTRLLEVHGVICMYPLDFLIPGTRFSILDRIWACSPFTRGG